MQSEAQPRQKGRASGASSSAAPHASAPSAASAPQSPSIPVPGNIVHVPGATLTMGFGGGTRSELKSHPVAVVSFDIDVTEVTVAAYKACVAASGCTDANEDKDGAQDVCTWWKRQPDLPINCVSHAHAENFCKWAGKRLPTEAEWELAARGTDDRVFPWGNDAPKAQPCWSGDPKFGNSNAGQGVACRVGSHPDDKSPFGAFDMAGNLSEWTSSGPCDFETRPCSFGPAFRVRRGGDHFASTPDPLRAVFRIAEVTTWGSSRRAFDAHAAVRPPTGGRDDAHPERLAARHRPG